MEHRPWTSRFFEDFTLLPNPRDPFPYDEEAREYCALNYRQTAAETRDTELATNYRAQAKAILSPKQRPDLFLCWYLLKGWERAHIGPTLDIRIEHLMIRFLCLLIPSVEPDPWFQERVWSFFDTRARSKQITNWFGGQSTGKTSTMAALAVGFGVLHHHLTRSTLSNPYKDAGEFQLWSETQSFFHEVQRVWGDKLAAWTGATYDLKAKTWRDNANQNACLMGDSTARGVLRFSEVPNAGTIRLVAMDKVGKTQGGKAKDKRQIEGYYLMFLDEIGAGYASLEFLQMLYNLKSNDRLHVFTGCNPKNPIGQLDGELARPLDGYEALKIDEDYVWDSAHNSRTYRFDGHLSPNIVWGRNVYPWLFNSEKQKRLIAATAVNSDKYNEQCRGFMPSGAGNRYVLTPSDIREGMVDQEFEWSTDQKFKIAFFDPALSTEGDNPVFTTLETGTRRLVDNSKAPVIYATKQMLLPVFTGLIADKQWVEKCALVRGKTAKDNHFQGQIIPVEQQLAINAAYQCLLEGIPFENYGYDDSLRSKVMEAMIWAMGDKPKVMSSVGDPEDIPMYPPKWITDEKTNRRRLVTWKEDCQKFVSQVWFYGAAIIRSGHFKCSPPVMIALNQACGRFWDYAAGGKKRFVESKRVMKERNSGQSPDHADSLFGALYLANKLGAISLKIDMPNALEHLTLTHKETFIMKQWKNKPKKLGLYATGTR